MKFLMIELLMVCSLRIIFPPFHNIFPIGMLLSEGHTFDITVLCGTINVIAKCCLGCHELATRC